MAELLILSVAGSESECSVVVEKTTPEEASEASEIAVEGGREGGRTPSSVRHT